MVYHAHINYRSEDRSNLWLPILGGYRGEVFGLPNGLMIYTGVCQTRQECIDELISQLKGRGFKGSLRVTGDR
jgi:hypothetical protein